MGILFRTSEFCWLIEFLMGMSERDDLRGLLSGPSDWPGGGSDGDKDWDVGATMKVIFEKARDFFANEILLANKILPRGDNVVWRGNFMVYFFLNLYWPLVYVKNLVYSSWKVVGILVIPVIFLRAYLNCRHCFIDLDIKYLKFKCLCFDRYKS